MRKITSVLIALSLARQGDGEFQFSPKIWKKFELISEMPCVDRDVTNAGEPKEAQDVLDKRSAADG